MIFWIENVDFSSLHPYSFIKHPFFMLLPHPLSKKLARSSCSITSRNKPKVKHRNWTPMIFQQIQSRIWLNNVLHLLYPMLYKIRDICLLQKDSDCSKKHGTHQEPVCGADCIHLHHSRLKSQAYVSQYHKN